MTLYTDRFFVLTGGPGSGKTTLVSALAEAGHATSVEAGRGVIKDQAAIGGTGLPWHGRALFAELMLSWEMRSHAIAGEASGPVWFDRGVPDVIGYARLVALPVPAHFERAAREFRYNRQVFILPHWPEIFTQDSERRQDEDEARRTHAAMIESYAACGYDLVEVPRAPVAERLAFVLERSRQP
ncbi:AAA family ATPase [Aminobacter aganoensis]|uniref:Putative ATPase n=1 Tax=Aminobacter aganoensis TaxID=83264 RepID=A0A7X0F4H2_9HYPH|nr:AAA family ATPase [Aminobacter aganoensis]MBB6352931.1 putative ATPase [Aminobacter aganoensis]